MKISLQAYLGPHVHIRANELNDGIIENANELLRRVSDLFTTLARHNINTELDPDTRSIISSGWRPPSYNAMVPRAAKRSKHMIGQAVDIYDPDGLIDEYLMHNQHFLRAHALWMEHPSATKGWCHLQSVSPRSGNLVFYP